MPRAHSIRLTHEYIFFSTHSQTSQLGLLTRLEKAGFTLTTAIPLLKAADDADVLGYLEASSDTVLPLVAKGANCYLCFVFSLKCVSALCCAYLSLLPF